MYFKTKAFVYNTELWTWPLLTLTQAREGGVIYHTKWFFFLRNLSQLSAEYVSYLWHYHWITLASETIDGIIISTSGFSIQIYKVNFCKLE